MIKTLYKITELDQLRTSLCTEIKQVSYLNLLKSIEEVSTKNLCRNFHNHLMRLELETFRKY